MSEADAPHVRRAEAEIAQGMADGSSSGYRGVIAELTRAFSALSDPNLMRMLSPPYDLSLEEITEGAEPWMVFCCVPAEAISPWAPILRSLFEAAKIHKARRPDAPRQVWILDECAQLKKWRLISDLFTYGAGIGIRPWAIYQSEKQMLETISNGDTILPASAAVRIYGGIRDLATATTLSRMIGNETRGYDDTLQQSRARQAKRQAIMDIIDGGDPFEAMMRARHQAGAAQHRSTQPRPLRTADEVLNTPLNKAYVFVDGLEHPIDADRTPYWRQRGMTTHVGDPYHPPIDETRFMIRWGERTRYVITEPAADYLTHLPQFKGGLSKRLSKTRPRKGSQANGRRHEGHAGKRTQPKRLPAPDKLLPKP
jgi:type IV secretion system protein VirD4